MRLAATGLILFAALTTSGCSPRLSPPYRDYDVGESQPDVPLRQRLEQAALEAGWNVRPSPLSPAVVSTEERRVNEGFFSTVDAALDLVPLDGGFVRIYVRGRKRSFLGGRSKVYALSSALRREILGPVTAALAERGLVAIDAPQERDEDATE